MIKFSYDNGTVEPFTVVLSTRDMRHLGQLSNIDEMNYSANLNSANEMSFKIYKEADGHEEVLWDELYDLRLIWVKELNEYFEITVEITDETYMTKTVTATSLCESELSQVYLFNVEINTEDDIARDDYDANYPTVFYRSLQGYTPDSEQYKKLKSSSLMHRILEKVPAYSIGTIDDSLINLQRTFSISNSTIYDFLTGECSEQFDCLFVFDSTTRTISAYDLFSHCMNPQCPYYLNTDNAYYTGNKHFRYRADFNDACPICNSKDYVERYGVDTTILVSTENLTDEVQYTTDVDSIKNCFRLEAGDDYMTATVINLNPNGSQYIYEFSDESKRDMPTQLVDLMAQYDEDYDYYNNTAEYTIEESAVSKYNTLCKKYNDDTVYHNGSDTWTQITNPIVGYKKLIPYYYKIVDFVSYLKSSMMPPVVIEDVTVAEEVSIVTKGLSSQEIGLSKTITEKTSQTTIENAILSYAKILIKTGFVKIEILDGTSSWSYSTKRWKGKFRITRVGDDDDYADTGTISVLMSDDMETFMREKIEKYLAKNTDEDYSVYGILSKSESDLKTELKKWCSTRLQSFYDAIQAVLGILIESGQGVSGADLKESFYDVYYSKLQICEDELNLRNEEIENIVGTSDDYTKISSGSFVATDISEKRIFYYITAQLDEIRAILNFKTYLNTKTGSDDLYKIFTSYKREDTYSNSNFVTDEDDDAANFERAQEFIELASNELHKSATYQHSINSNLNNLLLIPEFKPIIDNFELGNWIRVKADDTIYRLRLISYSINFDEVQNINTEFSDVTATSLGLNDIISQTKSLASSYGYIEKQSEIGAEVQKNYIDVWVEEGLNSSLIKINNNTNEDIVIDGTGITAKTSNDELSSGIDPHQLRITHNVLAFTDDNWVSVKTALGEFEFKYHEAKVSGSTTEYHDEKYGLVAEAVLAGRIAGSHIESSDMISGHIQSIGNYSYMDLDDDTLNYDTKYFLKCGYKDSWGNVTDNFLVDKTGTLISRSGRFEAADSVNYIDMSEDTSYDYIHFGDNFQVDKNGTVYSKSGRFERDSNNYVDLSGKNDYLHFNDLFRVDKKGRLYCTDATVSGTITASVINGTEINGGTITGSKIVGAIITTDENRTEYNSSNFGLTMDSNGIGAGDGSTNTFYVDTSGNLYAGKADISGTITSYSDTNKIIISDGVLEGYNGSTKVARFDWDGYVGSTTKLGISASGMLALGCSSLGVCDYMSTSVYTAVSDQTIASGAGKNLHFFRGILVGVEDGGGSSNMSFQFVTSTPTTFASNTIYFVRK